MPAIARLGPYRFYFYSDEGSEPPHVHIQRDRSLAKFWLEPPMCCSSKRFSSRELRRIGTLVAEHRSDSLEAWHDFFDA